MPKMSRASRSTGPFHAPPRRRSDSGSSSSSSKAGSPPAAASAASKSGSARKKQRKGVETTVTADEEHPVDVAVGDDSKSSRNENATTDGTADDSDNEDLQDDFAFNKYESLVYHESRCNQSGEAHTILSGERHLPKGASHSVFRYTFDHAVSPYPSAQLDFDLVKSHAIEQLNDAVDKVSETHYLDSPLDPDRITEKHLQSPKGNVCLSIRPDLMFIDKLHGFEEARLRLIYSKHFSVTADTEVF